MKTADAIGYALIVAILVECVVVVARAMREENRTGRRLDR